MYLRSRPLASPTLDFGRWTLDFLRKLGPVRETTGSRYGRLYHYEQYIETRNAESAGTHQS